MVTCGIEYLIWLRLHGNKRHIPLKNLYLLSCVPQHRTICLNCRHLVALQPLEVDTVKPLLSGHTQDLPKCPLNRGCPLKGFEIVKCLLTINIQRFLYTVIKFQVVNQAVPIQVRYQLLMLFVCMDLHVALFNWLFRGRNPILHCKINRN